jgi:site-specific recombinase XerD
MLLASTGMRAAEALSISNQNLNFGSTPARITMNAEYTKTKTDRFVYLTSEMVSQLKEWLNFKYGKRRICRKTQIQEKWFVNQNPK